MVDSLYTRLGGYDAITAVANDLLPRLMSDDLLARFWKNRGHDGLEREKQLLIDYLCCSAGGSLYYTGRDMLMTHKGMGVDSSDWDDFVGHLKDTLEKLSVPQQERYEVLTFIESTKIDIVE